jgi:hypothetical protein
LPSGNLVVNAGAEDGAASSDGSPVPVPGWATIGGFTVAQYGEQDPVRGANFFSGGAQAPSTAQQKIDLSAARKAIDAGRIDVHVGVLVGGSGTFTVDTSDADSLELSRRGFKGIKGKLTRFDEQIPIPPKARSVTLTMDAHTPADSFDNVLLTVSRRDTPRPERGKSVLVKPAKGVTVLFRRGNRKVITRPTLVPLGSRIDTTRGTATIVSADDRYGAVTERGSFSEGAFTVAQSGGILKVSLGGRDRSCKRPQRLVTRATKSFTVLAGASASRPAGSRAVWVADDRCTVTKLKKHRGQIDIMPLASRTASGPRRRLWGNARGRFRTRGRHASATIRGRVIAR